MDLKANDYEISVHEYKSGFIGVAKIYCIGFKGKSFWIGLMDSDPVVDDVINDDLIKPFVCHFNHNKGAFAVVWNIDQVLRFINGIDGDYLTHKQFLDMSSTKY